MLRELDETVIGLVVQMHAPMTPWICIMHSNDPLESLFGSQGAEKAPICVQI
jgi:hypothetical protein